MNTPNLAIVYGIVALLSALLTAFYLLWDKHRNRLFLALFVCVTASNCGYFLLSVCNSLPAAKFANGLSYFGGAFSMLVMLFIIYDVCKLKRRQWMLYSSVVISFAAFALAASGDWMGLYYRSMSIETVNGMTHLLKEYGPLHDLYALYLAAYVVIMLEILSGKQKEFDAFAEDSVIGDLQMQTQVDSKWLSALVEEAQKRLQKQEESL